jgi:death on curing protein
VQDPGLLQSAVARPQATFDGQGLSPDLFWQAAALLESLVKNHPFVDGNKRTAIAAAALFLRRNGWQLSAINTEVEAITLRCTQSELPVDQLASWFADHTQPGK